MKFSIIIPTFNAGECICRCLESIFKSSFYDYQIILIDDGSTDNTEELIKKYITDERVRYFKKSNEGVSAARNYGINKAEGDYILFIDADDTIGENLLEKISVQITETRCDLVLFGFKILGDSRRKNDTDVLHNLGRLDKIDTKDIVIEMLKPENGLFGYCRRNCYKKKLIHDESILFNRSVKISEDYLFMFEAVIKSKVISVLPLELYSYIINENSVTTKYIPSLKRDMEFVNGEITKMLSSKYSDLVNCFRAQKINTLIRIIQNECRAYNFFVSYRNAKSVIKEYKIYLKDISQFKNQFSKKLYFGAYCCKYHLIFLYILIFMAKNGLLWRK